MKAEIKAWLKSSGNMKTKTEILKWILRQDWHPQFKKEFEKEKDRYSFSYPMEDFLDFHLDLDPENAILGAFLWDNTQEGYNFWKKVDETYQRFLFLKGE